ncbi:MAG: helix-turn-helix transcriptional regulator [Brevinematales bacterium]|jgi:DNA-binding CsgD family transcriptional regulator
MGQWFILYLFIILMIGIFALNALIQLVLESRDRLLREFLLLFGNFTLLILETLILDYIATNIRHPSVTPVRFLIILIFFSYNLVPYTIFRYVAQAKKIAGVAWLRYSIIFASILLLISEILAFMELPFQGFKLPQPFVWIYIALNIIIIVIAFIPIRITQSPLTAPYKSYLHDFYKSIRIISFIFTPLMFTDMALNINPVIPFYSLLYCSFAILLIVFLNRDRVNLYKKSSSLVPESSFYKRFWISRRESEVLQLVMQGKTSPQIAGELFISLATVKTHIQRIFQKTGAASRFDLIRLLLSEKGSA